MQEFMLFIRKKNNSEQTLSAEAHTQFLKACESYIANLKQQNKLNSAQPIQWAGKVISGRGNSWTEVSFNENGEVFGGYYHILANDLNEAISIAKDNPEFKFNEGMRMEVRPLKMKRTQQVLCIQQKKLLFQALSNCSLNVFTATGNSDSKLYQLHSSEMRPR